MVLNVNKWNVLKIPKVHADSLKVAWLQETNLETMYFPFSWTMKQRKMAKSWKIKAKAHTNHTVHMVGALPLLLEQLSKQYPVHDKVTLSRILSGPFLLTWPQLLIKQGIVLSTE